MNQQGKLQSPTSTEVCIGIDWISTTSHDKYDKDTFNVDKRLMDWNEWSLISGSNGYDIGAKHNPSGIKSYKSSSRKDMGTHTIYSGTTLKKLKRIYQMNSQDILKSHVESGHSITRIDLMIDFKECGLDVQMFQDAFLNGYADTRLRSASMIKNLTDKGHTFYIGSRKSRKKLVRIYDKSAELNIDGNWVRVELQLMGKPATQLSKEMMLRDSIEQTILEAIKGVINFPTIREWSHVFAYKRSIRLTGNTSQQSNTRKWLTEQVFTALAREISLDYQWWTQYKFSAEQVAEKMAKSSQKA